MSSETEGEPAAKRARMEDGSAVVIVDEVNIPRLFRKISSMQWEDFNVSCNLEDVANAEGSPQRYVVTAYVN
jgi:hypothetical protein